MSTPPVRLALVGLMGSGKSKVGRLCAQALGWSFRDTDALLVAAVGRDIPTQFADDGEPVFRDRETGVLADQARTPAPFILATGGGVVEREANRACLRQHFLCVWLDILPEEAARRVGQRTGRPLLADQDPVQVLRILHRRREPWYREISALRLETHQDTHAEDLRDAILDFLESRDPQRDIFHGM